MYCISHAYLTLGVLFNYGHSLFFYSASVCFFFNDPAPTEIYTLSLHDALPICRQRHRQIHRPARPLAPIHRCRRQGDTTVVETDRKSTRLNSSHMSISYAVFCLKKKKNLLIPTTR